MDSSLNSANQSVSPDLGDAKLTPDCEINLCDDFNPGPWDVICSRGMVSFANEGNIRLREMVDGSVEEYLQADRNERVAIVSRIIDTVMTKANVGFVRQDSDTNRWMKASQTLRSNCCSMHKQQCLQGHILKRCPQTRYLILDHNTLLR
ncbi:hypothetical protein ACA910_010565 [Epithemia clementina (nom. ined.)]